MIAYQFVIISIKMLTKNSPEKSKLVLLKYQILTFKKNELSNFKIQTVNELPVYGVRKDFLSITPVAKNHKIRLIEKEKKKIDGNLWIFLHFLHKN